ncbi:hypothetical protein [Haloarcula halophila]|uniref:hypothetical protein n=1 Tax=Haloarcula halophila TaxID=3032584 RepID=UPI0023E40BC4|nr:hypothetical protein [Halomicroarcula sp. DFY41]
MGDLADSIITELRQKFDRHPVWVWYDAQEKYKGVLDEVEAALDNVTLARYDGSYFELKRRLYEEDPNYEKNWLFYIPESRNEAEWFRDIHALGRQYRVGQDIDDTPVTQFLVEHDEEIPDAYEDWGQNREVQRLAFFCVLFDTAGPETDEWVRAYLSNPEEYRETIEDNAMADAWDAQLREEYGVTAGLDPKELRLSFSSARWPAEHRRPGTTNSRRTIPAQLRRSVTSGSSTPLPSSGATPNESRKTTTLRRPSWNRNAPTGTLLRSKVSTWASSGS